VTNYKRFVFSNYSNDNSTDSQSGFSYNLLLNYTNQNAEGESFHIYVVKSDSLPHSELLNNPAICCTDQGGVICGDNNRPSTVIKQYSIYNKDVILNNKNSTVSINDVTMYNVGDDY
jgi:hypothetical protein